jgi:hypothetical protein
MSCDGGHLGFPIGIKNSNLVKNIPMIIHLQFGFSQFISFREEDLWNFSQSEHIIGPGSHVEYPTGTKNSNFVEDHPRNIPAKFGSNWPSGFGEEAWNVGHYVVDLSSSICFTMFSCNSICSSRRILFSSPRWTIAITWRLSSVNFSHFKLLLRNHWANWNQT